MICSSTSWRLTILATAGLLILAFGSAGTTSAQGIEKEIEAARARIEAARESHLDRIAPKSFAKAGERLEDAEKRYRKGGKIEDIRERLAELDRHLARCRELEEMGHVILRDALVARADAAKSHAADLATGIWEDAERKLTEAGEKIEGGDQNAARTNAATATGLYRDAEYAAIRRDILEGVWALRNQTRERKAEERAPTTLASAEQLLATTETSIKNDRYGRDRAESLARETADVFRHTLNICDYVEKMESDRKTGPERVIRGHEGEIAKIAEALGVRANFAEGIGSVTNEVIAEMRRREKERIELEEKVASLEGELDGVRTRVATLSDRDALLQQRERHEVKMQEVREVFKREEADVLLRGDQMIIRLYGLSFPVGSAEIRPENFALLSKIRRVLAEFPESAIAIEGHTDSQGAAERNRDLSQRRADAVREYLLANTSIVPARIASVGHGEDRPIANNETEEGRAKNRRIDLTVNLSAS